MLRDDSARNAGLARAAVHEGDCMKAKPCLLIRATLLLAGVAASAAPVPPATPAPDAALAAAASARPEAPALCQATASHLASPILGPAPRPLTVQICGSCSTGGCAGVGEGSVCRISQGKVFTCLNALGNSCSSDGLDQCLCWNGPLP